MTTHPSASPAPSGAPASLPLVRARLAGSRAAIAWLERNAEPVAGLVDVVGRVLRGGGLLATCGNGGSAAEALHLAEELIGRYRSNRAPHRAICLNADPTALTCIANDFGFEQVFARQVDALLGSGDALVVFSTSGHSANIVAALRAARARGATTIGLLGHDGGPALPLCDHAVVAPMNDSAHVQEVHQVIMHLLCEGMER